MKKLILSTLLFALAFTASAQLNNIKKQTKKDTTLSSIYRIPVQDSTTGKVYQLPITSIGKTSNWVDTATGTPPVSKILVNTFKPFRDPVTDSVFIWFNIGGTIRKN